MDFHNNVVDPADLPRLEVIALLPVSRRFAPYQVLSGLWRWVLLVTGAWFIASMGNAPAMIPPLVAAVFAALGVTTTTVAWLEARRRGFALREHDLLYRKGLFIRTTTVLPLVRIQHVETVSGPLERLFKLERLTCYTAGGSSADLELAGLEQDSAERVRRHLLAHIRKQTPEPGQVAAPAHPAARAESRADSGTAPRGTAPRGGRAGRGANEADAND